MDYLLDSVILIDNNETTNLLVSYYIDKIKLAPDIKAYLNPEIALKEIQQTPKENYSRKTLVLLDINMPEMDSWEFMDHYQTLSDELKQNYCIVLHTSSLESADRKKAKNYTDIAGFVEKPASDKMLRKLVQELF